MIEEKKLEYYIFVYINLKKKFIHIAVIWRLLSLYKYGKIYKIIIFFKINANS